MAKINQQIISDPVKENEKLKSENAKLRKENERMKAKLEKQDIQLDRATLKLEKQELVFMKQKTKYEETTLQLGNDLQKAKSGPFAEADLSEWDNY